MAVLAAEQKCRCFRFWAILNALNFIYSGPPTGLTIERGYGPFGPGDVHAAAGICRASRLRGGVAACRAGAATSEAANHWVYRPEHGLSRPHAARRFCKAARRARLGRGPQHCDRISLGRRRRRARRRDRGRVRSTESRCHRRKRGCPGACGKAGNRCDPDCYRRLCRSGRQRPGGKPGAARRQRHGPVKAVAGFHRQAARNLA